VGGGSGGHVTPVAAIAKEVKLRQSKAVLRFWTDRKFAGQARPLMGQLDDRIPVSTIISGKLRRFHHMSLMQHLLSPELMLLNTRDSLLVFIGFVESLFKLIVWRPDVIFTKGGYVCLPVGMAARVLAIPLVIHDSDAHPGLTNRVLSRWAKRIATGAPLEYYDYPAAKSQYVGIPIASDFHKLNQQERDNAREEWGITPGERLIVITGGGLGAKRINEASVKVIDDLMDLGNVVLITGTDQYDEINNMVPKDDKRIQVHAFVTVGIASLFGAADVVVTRAGATTILELASVGVPTVLIPNARLTGGHQLKNAAVYSDADAVKVVDEDSIVDNPGLITKAIRDIFSNSDKTKQMTKRFSKFAKPHATNKMTDIILAEVGK